MARVLTLEVKESAEYLHNSMNHAQSAKQKERLQMLWWLKSGQVTQHQQLSARLGRNPSTVTRWLNKYREGGLTGLLEVKTAPGKPLKIQGEVLERLSNRLESEEGFASYGAVQAWLEDELGQAVPYKTVHKTVRYRLGAKLKVPRPVNAKQDPTAVAAFKQTSDEQ